MLWICMFVYTLPYLTYTFYVPYTVHIPTYKHVIALP